jgi:hypothetical protein
MVLIFRSTTWTISFREISFNPWVGYHLSCRFENLSFKNGIHEKIEFEVTDQQKRDTTVVWFSKCSAADFIDLEILKKFPNLIGLKFCNSNIQILKNIFTVELKLIQYLDLAANKIKNLEAHVFDELVELKWISLSGNEIEEILHPIFAKNKKLKVVNLSENKIHTLYPNLFVGLPRLEAVQFYGNPTINSIFFQPNVKTDLIDKLEPLFNNYLMRFGASRIRELDLVNFFALTTHHFKN